MEIGGNDIDEDWENFLEGGTVESDLIIPEIIKSETIPKGTDLYISTKTKITYLSHPINLFETYFASYTTLNESPF